MSNDAAIIERPLEVGIVLTITKYLVTTQLLNRQYPLVLRWHCDQLQSHHLPSLLPQSHPVVKLQHLRMFMQAAQEDKVHEVEVEVEVEEEEEG